MASTVSQYRDDDEHPAPPSVVAATAVGTAALPFLAVYAVMFLVHGSIHPVVPPDITRSTSGEFVAGLIATALFVISLVALIWAIGGRRRWPFATVQGLMFVTALYFLIDGSEGGTGISVLVLLIAFAALVLIFLPSAWPHFGRTFPAALRARVKRRRAPIGATGHATMPAGSGPVSDVAPPAGTRLAGRPGPADANDVSTR